MESLKAQIRGFLSHEAGPFAQFVKYGVIGVMSTCVQTGIFYLLAITPPLRCLTAGDWAVKLVGLPCLADGEAAAVTIAFRAAICTAVGFTFANVFCWLMNRWFVFKPGKFRWYVEFGMFFGAATLATAIALGVQSVLIAKFHMMTTLAVLIEIIVSFFVNFFVRKFVIFKR